MRRLRRNSAWKPAANPAASRLHPRSALALRRLLTSRDVYGKDHVTSGRLNPQRFSRAMTGSEIVFRRATFTPAVRTALTVLVDMSGSMKYDNIDNAAGFLTAIAPSLELARTNWQVIGFTSVYSHQSYGDGIGDATRSVVVDADAHTVEEAMLTRFKSFTTPYQRVAGKMENALRHSCTGGTPDYAAVYQCVAELAKRPEERKILLVLTDGIGAKAQVRATCDYAAQRGIEVIGVGIGVSVVVRDCYPHHAQAADAASLLSVALPALVDTLIKARIKAGRA